jgi:Pectate lyase superfamily protein
MKKLLFVLFVFSISIITVKAKVINVKDFGAKGDNRHDDTAAIQNAINKASSPPEGGILYFPAGHYLVSKTLIIEYAQGLIMRGEGCMGYKANYGTNKTTQSVLIWNGEPDGILLHSIGSFSGSYEDIAFAGKKVNSPEEKQAGILFLSTGVKGFGNMLHSFSNVSFSYAKVGLQMGSENSVDMCNSDMVFNSIYFGFLDSGIKTCNTQAVDYTFNFVFGLKVKTVFDFRKGGNLLVNTAQLTCSNLLYIGENGSNSCTYMFNNVRIEGGIDAQKRNQRFYAVKTSNKLGVALIKFNNFCDAQWYWSRQTQRPQMPLFNINGGTLVEIKNSMFQGPVATVNGSTEKNARLKIADSVFKFIIPKKAVKANATGFYKLIDKYNNNLKLFPNKKKWK